MLRNMCGILTSFLLFSIAGVLSHDSLVPDLSEEDFVRKHSEGRLSIVLFYAPWCGHCKSFMPVYDSFAQIAAAELPNTLVTKVDATKSPKLSQQFQIQGYPTLLMLRDAKICKYEGERELTKLTEWAKGIIKPSVLETPEQTEAILSSPLYSIVAYFEEEETPLEAVLVDLLCEGSIKAQGGIHFIREKEFADQLKFSDDKNVAIYRAGAEPEYYNGPADKKELSLFIAFASNPIVLEYSSANSNIIFHSAIKNYLFVQVKKDETDMAALAPILDGVAKELFGSVRVSWLDVDSTDGKAAVDFFGVRHTPSLVAYNSSSNLIYGDITVGTIDAEKIKKFVSDYFDNKLKPFRKEQPLPEDWNTGPVYQLVAGNFDEVLKWGKPTFVMFYAPWCGHCKALKPDWEKLGTIYNLPNNEGKVVIAKCDSTQNDIEGVTVQHFPTLIVFMPDGSKVPYDGERNLDALKSFIDSGFKPKPKSDDKDKKGDKPAGDSAHDEL